VRIEPIVEGHGEVSAVPVLLRRLCDAAGAHGIGIGSPIRRSRSEFTDELKLKKAVELATWRPDCGAVLILFDADSACAKEEAPRVAAWAAAAAGAVPCAVVMATREYEAWFLATLDSLRGKRGIRPDATAHARPEAPRGAKAALEDRMVPGRTYSPTTDQAALTESFDLREAHLRCRSFRRLVRAFGILVRACGVRLDEWPPADWSNARR
jgi:hypothetical protein